MPTHRDGDHLGDGDGDGDGDRISVMSNLRRFAKPLEKKHEDGDLESFLGPVHVRS